MPFKTKLDDTRKLLSDPLEEADPRGVLLEVLRASVERLSIEDNDFAWSAWEDSAAALAEVNRLLAVVASGGSPDRNRETVCQIE